MLGARGFEFAARAVWVQRPELSHSKGAALCPLGLRNTDTVASPVRHKDGGRYLPGRMGSVREGSKGHWALSRIITFQSSGDSGIS